jgi:D-glycero-D-manno-heptose 1,7-bisphosphate phosphatase
MADRLRPAAFVDRDGVINIDHGYVHRIEDFELVPGVVEGLSELARLGFSLVVVTNQGGIARGMYTEDDFLRLTAHMREMLASAGVVIAGVYHCPHHPHGTVARLACTCRCRKPAPGLLLQAAEELGLDIARSVLVGDQLTDIAAARAAGVRWALLVGENQSCMSDQEISADAMCADLPEAARWITEAAAGVNASGEHR